MTERVVHSGGCHCGRVRFEVTAPAVVEAIDCNCSICSKSGYLHLIVGRDDFRLLQGKEDLAEYRFGSRTARHFFCRVCGVKPFYVPRSHPDGYSANVRCLDPGTVREFTVRPFDGAHWEDHIDEIR